MEHPELPQTRRRAVTGLAVAILALPVVVLAATTSGVLPEGAVLRSVDGNLVPVDANDVWLFELSDDVNVADVQVPAGTRLELLPSATLGQMIADANERLVPQYRLVGQVTRYDGRNFVLASYYLPLSKLKDADEPAQMQETPAMTSAGQTGSALAIPDEALELLRSRRPVRGQQHADANAYGVSVRSAPTRMLVNQTGSIELHQDRWWFAPDGLGWNVAPVRYELLPCSMLEQTQRIAVVSSGLIRFNVSGLVTEYRGSKHLILERAVRVYSYGNFND